MFVHKPPVLVRHDDVAKIHFARSGGNTRSFDLELQLYSSPGNAALTFSSIQKEEIPSLMKYLKAHKLKVTNPEEVDEILRVDGML
jgi:hypothetical protein